ncbi:tetratricopeptide repeat protein [Pendulispora rubella]|uniref:Tetratricopeptide repeat protein n=1 Tax=Pendulispora rubella TaxID=2741070 RepID=A0ABZ2LGJ8_9BACT
MQKLIDAVVDRLKDFVAQNQRVLLVVESNDASNGLLVKCLDVIDQDASDIFWTFVDDFTDAVAFVNAVASGVRIRRELACKALAKSDGAPWPELPPEAGHLAIHPALRMRALMTYARALSSNPDEQHLVWNLFPATITDPVGYRAFVLELMVHEFPSPWCHHMRVVIRDDVARPALRDAVQVLRGADWFAPRLGPHDIEKAVEEQVGDESLSVDERVQALLTLAGLDYAHGRFGDALAKYALAGRYYAGTGKLALYALTLNGIGEVHARTGNPEQARKYFESALTPATNRLSQANEPGRIDAIPVLLNVSLNLGNLYLSQNRWADAGRYYEGARDIAHGMANAHVEIQCIENIGACHFELGQYREAAQAWEKGTGLARTIQADEHLRTLLQRQRDAYNRLGLTDRRDAVDTELRHLPGGA